jgi:hypothetical protein
MKYKWREMSSWRAMCHQGCMQINVGKLVHFPILTHSFFPVTLAFTILSSLPVSPSETFTPSFDLCNPEVVHSTSLIMGSVPYCTRSTCTIMSQYCSLTERCCFHHLFHTIIFLLLPSPEPVPG